VNDLLIEKKIDHLFNKEVYPLLKHFPNAEKHALCKDIKTTFVALATNVMLANSVKCRRREYQDKADGYQKTLLFLFNTAYQQKYITEKKKEFLQRKLEEIGRLLGGWMKSNK